MLTLNAKISRERNTVKNHVRIIPDGSLLLSDWVRLHVAVEIGFGFMLLPSGDVCRMSWVLESSRVDYGERKYVEVLKEVTHNNDMWMKGTFSKSKRLLAVLVATLRKDRWLGDKATDCWHEAA